LLGFKTDGAAKGETFRINGCSVPKVCPVRTLHSYLLHRGTSRITDSVFKVGAQRISRILASVLKKAGLDTDIFTARCFRSGGATSGIEAGVDPYVLMKIGRWKSADVFFNHYVAARPQHSVTDKILGVVIPDEDDDDDSDEYIIVATPNTTVDPPDSDRDAPNSTLTYYESSSDSTNNTTLLPSQNVFSTPEFPNSSDNQFFVDASVPSDAKLLIAWNSKMASMGFDNASIPASADLNRSLPPDEEDLSGHASSF
jgi:hypothetical protein